MFLTLSERAPLWFYGDIHFSLNDRGPKNVDVESLDSAGKQMVANAISCGVLIKSDTSDSPITSKPIEQSAKISSPQARVDGLKVQAANNLKGSAKTVISLLKKKKPGYNLLSIMLEIESSKQKRKTVIKTIDGMLENTGGVTTVDDSDIDEVQINVV